VIIILAAIWVLTFSLPAHAYIDAVGGGLIFQVGYIIFTGMLVFLALPFRKIASWFKRNKLEDNHSQK